MELFTRLRDEGVFAKNTEGVDADAMTEMFFTEKAAMMQAGSWSYGALPPAMADHVALGGFPVLDGSTVHTKPVIYAGFGKAVWITRNGARRWTPWSASSSSCSRMKPSPSSSSAWA